MRPLFQFVLWNVVVAGGYFIAAVASFSVLSESDVSLFWLPAGFALAAVILGGWKMLPGVFAGSASFSIWVGDLWISAAGIAVANTFEAALGYWLVSRRNCVKALFQGARPILEFLLLGAIISPLASSLFALPFLGIGHYWKASNYTDAWLSWWMGDWLGVTLVAPLILAAARARTEAWETRRTIEAALLVLVILLGNVALEIFPKREGLLDVPMVLFLLPPLMLAPFRLGPFGVCSILFLCAASMTAHELNLFQAAVPVAVDWSLNVELLILASTTMVVQALVAERNSAIKRLEEINRKLEQAQSIGHVGMWRHDLATDALEWSAETFRIFGRDPNGPPPFMDDFLQTVHRSDRQTLQKELERIRRDGSHPGYHFRIIRPDGGVRHLIGRGEVERDESGNVSAVIGSVLDVTELQEAIERWQSSENQKQAALDALPDGVLLIDATGAVQAANPSAQKIFGMDEHALRLINFLKPQWAFFREDGSRIEPEQFPAVVTLRTGEPLDRVIMAMEKPDGRRVWLSTNTRPVRRSASGEIEAVVISLIDITKQREIEAQIRVVNQRIQEIQRMDSMRVMAGGIAHAFNNWLTIMMGQASLLRYKASEPSEQKRLDQIISTGELGAQLCRQLLLYSGKSPGMPKPVYLPSFLEEMRSLLQASISKKARLQIESAGNIPHVLMDEMQLQQIILNLVVNASEALQDQEGAIVIRVSTTVLDADSIGHVRYGDNLQPGEYVCLEVCDTGCGIDAATIDRIFEPFYTTKFAGRGLGLAAVAGLVREAGGGIQVSSEKGKGTRFSILLAPAGSVDEYPTTQPARSMHAAGSGVTGPAGRRRHARIMVVDDEELVRQTVADILKQNGHNAVAVGDGQTALDILRASNANVDLVLLDITMPEMSGLTVFSKIQSEFPGLPVIFMSGHSAEELGQTLKSPGCAGFLQKPMPPSALVAEVEKALAAGRRA